MNCQTPEDPRKADQSCVADEMRNIWITNTTGSALATDERRNLLLSDLVCKAKHALNVGQVDGVDGYVQVLAECLGVAVIVGREFGTANEFICNDAEFSSSSFRALFVSAGQNEREAIAPQF